MYYESIQHSLISVDNCEQAVNFVRKKNNPELYSNSAVSWSSDGKNYFLVPDGGINSPFFELALICSDNESSIFYGIDSITSGWIEKNEELIQIIEESIKNFDPKEIWLTQLIIGSAKGTETARFTCGCCGNSFKSNVKYQQTFDQDAGYGICHACEKYYR